MPTARVQFAENSGTAITSLTVTLGSPTTAGNLLVVAVSVDGGASPAGAPSSVTLVGSSDTLSMDVDPTSTNPTASVNLSAWSDQNCSGGHTQVTATVASSAAILMMVWEVSGAATTSALVASHGAGNPANTLQAAFDSGAGVSISAGAFLVGVVTGIGSGGRAQASPTGAGTWTTETALQPGSVTQMLGAYQANASSGAPQYTGTFTTVQAYWASFVVAYKAVGGAANTRTASLTVATTLAVARTRATFHTASLTVPITLAAARTRATFHSASLNVSITRTVSRVGAHPRTTALTVTPTTHAVASGGSQKAIVVAVAGIRLAWTLSGGRVGGS